MKYIYVSNNDHRNSITFCSVFAFLKLPNFLVKFTHSNSSWGYLILRHLSMFLCQVIILSFSDKSLLPSYYNSLRYKKKHCNGLLTVFLSNTFWQKSLEIDVVNEQDQNTSVSLFPVDNNMIDGFRISLSIYEVVYYTRCLYFLFLLIVLISRNVCDKDFRAYFA